MSGDATTDGGILGRLRAETRAEHDAIERALGLDGEGLTRATYRHVLERFLGYYRPVEDKLRALGGWEAVGLDLEKRRKAPLLEADLRALAGDGTRPPVCPHLPPLDDRASGFGCLYVLEGATLGGQVIGPHARRLLGVTPEAGGRFFHGYGSETGAMWRAFRSALLGFADTPERRDRVVLAATLTFRTLRVWCQEGWPRPTATS